MRRPIVPPLALALALMVALAGPVRAADAPFVDGHVLVRWKSGVTTATRRALRATVTASPSRIYDFIDAELLDVPAGTVAASVARLALDPSVEWAEPDYLWHASVTPDDSLFTRQWALRNTGQTGGTPGADIHATTAWDVSTGDSTLMIGVIDTGIDYTHPDLAGNIWTNPGEIPGNGIDDDGDGYVDDVHGYDFDNNDGDPLDDNGHGTHVAGTIAARADNGLGVAGVCWRARLVPIKFLGASGTGSIVGRDRGARVRAARRRAHHEQLVGRRAVLARAAGRPRRGRRGRPADGGRGGELGVDNDVVPSTRRAYARPR